MFGEPVFWRDTMKPAKFLIFDVRAALALFPALMHLRPWTIALAIAVMGVFWWFDRKGVPADSILRYLRARLVGPRRSARGVYEERLPVDFGFECRVYLEHARLDAARGRGVQSAGSSRMFGTSPNFSAANAKCPSARALAKRKENCPFGHSMGVARDDEETLRTERPEFEAGAQRHRDWRHAPGNADGAGRGS